MDAKGLRQKVKNFKNDQKEKVVREALDDYDTQLSNNRASKYKLQEKILDELEMINLRQKDFKKELNSIKDSL